MERERWRQIDDLLERALEVSPEERGAFLDGACREDETLCLEVQRLLRAHERAGGFLAEPALQVAAREMAIDQGGSLVGRQLGHYQVLALVGTGGMGEVYLARDTRLNRKVAIKLLLPSLTHDQDRLRRFEKEARAASALNHPDVVTVFDIGSVQDARFMVTEFVDGQTLRHRLQTSRLEPREAVGIALQVARALADAHLAGIVHRDIKPENIVVRRDGLVKVLDFGLAKLIEAQQENGDTSRSGYLTGTPCYMSPEQARGSNVDARSDIFSLGAVLYEMVTGVRPFEGETASHIIVSILEREPMPVGKRVPAAPRALEDIVRKALAKDRNDRYGHVQEMRDDLAEMLWALDTEESKHETCASAHGLPRLTTAATSSAHSDHPNNLREMGSALIGRQHEVAAIERLLRRDDVRLVTLTGVGGTGKTRLAQAAGRLMLARFADGVFFIDLAAITDPELVLLTIAHPLGVKEAGGRCLPDCLKDYLRPLRMLLVLDNFEQVLSAAPLVAELLVCSRQLKILVTSRARLHLSAEHELPVPPLALAPGGGDSSASELMDYAAIALFVDRARAVKPAFGLTDENARSVAEVCARLDGLPLAIELAAARVRLLRPQAILTRLEHRLELLTGGARDSPKRQQTMRATVEWSYDLLDRNEKRLFQCLAVFAGGFTLDAAETVCRRTADGNGAQFAGQCAPIPGQEGMPGDTPLSPVANRRLPDDVLDGVASLVDKSLLVQAERPDGESRFRLLEVVREYALEALDASGEGYSLSHNHARYFLALAEEAEPQLLETQSVLWLDRLEDEHDNLRAALRWSTEHDAAAALRLAGAIQYFWLFHGHLTEGRRWLEEALERSGDATDSARPKVQFGAGTLARIQGDYHSAYRFYDESLAGSKAAGDKRQIALSCEGLGSVVAFLHNDLVAARRCFEEGLSIGRELGDHRVIATSLNNLAELERAEGNYAAARPLYEEALALHRQKGDKEGQSICHGNLGALAYYEADLDAARSHYAEDLATAEDLGNKIDIAIALDGFAAIMAKRGDVDQAAQLMGAVDGLRESIGCDLETAADRLFRHAYVSLVRAALSEALFASAYEHGRSLKLREAIALAVPTSVACIGFGL